MADGEAVAQDRPSRVRRTGHVVGAVLVVAVLPAALMWALVGEFGAAAPRAAGRLRAARGPRRGGARTVPGRASPARVRARSRPAWRRARRRRATYAAWRCTPAPS